MAGIINMYCGYGFHCWLPGNTETLVSEWDETFGPWPPDFFVFYAFNPDLRGSVPLWYSVMLN